jgi:hypothetical protein
MKRRLLKLILGTIIVLMGYSIFVHFAARSSAINLAAGQPYCIQVAQKSDYKTMTKMYELAGFFMSGGGSKNHAVLVVGDPESPALYHWSYWQSTFQSGAYGPPPIYCEPRADFLATLKDFQHEPGDMVTFRMGGYRFAIPRAYEPKPLWPSADGKADIAVSARGPDFTPMPGNRFKEMPHGWFQISAGYDSKIESWRHKPGAGKRIEGLGQFEGLIKERVNSGELQFYATGADGRTVTLVRCVDQSNSACIHLFHDGGFSYFFHHMPADLDDWKAMQARARAVAEGFFLATSDERQEGGSASEFQIWSGIQTTSGD